LARRKISNNLILEEITGRLIRPILFYIIETKSK